LVSFDRPRNTGASDSDQPGRQGAADQASPHREPGTPLLPKDAWSRPRISRGSGEQKDEPAPKPVDLGAENYELRQKNYQLEMGNKLLRTAKDAQQEKNAGLERKNAEQDKQIADLKDTNAALWKKVAELDKKLDALTARPGGVHMEHENHSEAKQPSTEIGDRVGGGADDRGNRAKPERRWHLPSDTANNLLALSAGGAVTTAADYIPHISPTSAGMGATGLAIGAGAVAWWREHRKAKNDAGHRSEG
jgi:uncharacterized coiled-coil protein SlyX